MSKIEIINDNEILVDGIRYVANESDTYERCGKCVLRLLPSACEDVDCAPIVGNDLKYVFWTKLNELNELNKMDKKLTDLIFRLIQNKCINEEEYELLMDNLTQKVEINKIEPNTPYPYIPAVPGYPYAPIITYSNGSTYSNTDSESINLIKTTDNGNNKK